MFTHIELACENLEDDKGEAELAQGCPDVCSLMIIVSSSNRLGIRATPYLKGPLCSTDFYQLLIRENDLFAVEHVSVLWGVDPRIIESWDTHTSSSVKSQVIAVACVSLAMVGIALLMKQSWIIRTSNITAMGRSYP